MLIGIRFSRKYYKELIAAAFYIISYMPTLIWMWDRWFARDSYYSHGILVPFVTGFLIWQRKDQLVTTIRKPSPWALPIFSIGMIIHLFGLLMRVYFISGFSMLVVLIGLIFYFYGYAVFRQIIFPLFFLVFMIPVPLIIVTAVSFRMKIFAAKIAAAALNNSGLPAIREGSVIRMAHAQVIVDDVCSGLRSLISLLALGSIFAYWMKSTIVRRCILCLAAVSIAVVTNVFRIIFLSAVAEIWDPRYASGFLHDLSGVLVFAFAYILLYVAMKVLE